MKKLLILFGLILFSSCSCLIGQIPPQYLYVDETCGAALPDYLSKIEVSDNCAVDTVEQTPTSGSWLTVPVTTVLIRARDKFGNKTDMMFTVTLLDTVPPVINVTDSTLFSENYMKINKIYDVADKMLARQDWALDWSSLYAKLGIPDSVADWDDYANNVLVTVTTPLHAFTGLGGRWHYFANVGDTILIK